MNRLASWIVLTEGNGSWRDDWDGEVHKERDDALSALNAAQVALGTDSARLVRLSWDDEDADNEDEHEAAWA